MPIIPRYDSIQGDIPTPKYATPTADMFPEATTAAIAGGVSKIAGSVSDMAMKYAEQQGYLKANTLKAELAVKLDAAMSAVKTAPQKTVEGIRLDSGDPGGLDEPVATTTLVPRSQSAVPDYLDAQKKVVEDIKARAGNNPYIMRHLQPAIERQQATAQKSMEAFALQQYHQENHATVLESTELLARAAGSLPAVPATKDEAGNIAINPDDDGRYDNLRKSVAQQFDDAVRVGGIPADQAEKSKLARLAKMDHGRAEQTLVADPYAWAEASAHGRNGWKDRLTPEAMEKLDEKADRILKRVEGSANQQRLDRQRVWEQDAFLKLRSRELSLTDIDEAVRNRTIDAEHATVWQDRVQKFAAGHWDSDGATVLKMSEMAHNPGVNKYTFYAKAQSLLKPGGLNIDDFDKLNTVAAGIHDRRTDVKFRESNQTYGNVHSVISTTLATPQSFMGTNHEQATQLIRSNAMTEFSQYLEKNEWAPEAQMKWEKERLPYYARQMTGYAKTQVDVQNRLLGGLQMRPDPKSGYIEPDEIKKARQNAFKKYGIDPAQTEALAQRGLFPEELKATLQRIYDIQHLTDWQRSVDAQQGGK